jgi:hypothetical protein
MLFLFSYFQESYLQLAVKLLATGKAKQGWTSICCSLLLATSVFLFTPYYYLFDNFKLFLEIYLNKRTLLFIVIFHFTDPLLAKIPPTQLSFKAIELRIPQNK